MNSDPNLLKDIDVVEVVVVASSSSSNSISSIANTTSANTTIANNSTVKKSRQNSENINTNDPESSDTSDLESNSDSEISEDTDSIKELQKSLEALKRIQNTSSMAESERSNVDQEEITSNLFTVYGNLVMMSYKLGKSETEAKLLRKVIKKKRKGRMIKTTTKNVLKPSMKPHSATMAVQNEVPENRQLDIIDLTLKREEFPIEIDADKAPEKLQPENTTASKTYVKLRWWNDKLYMERKIVKRLRRKAQREKKDEQLRKEKFQVYKNMLRQYKLHIKQAKINALVKHVEKQNKKNSQ